MRKTLLTDPIFAAGRTATAALQQNSLRFHFSVSFTSPVVVSQHFFPSCRVPVTPTPCNCQHQQCKHFLTNLIRLHWHYICLCMSPWLPALTFCSLLVFRHLAKYIIVVCSIATTIYLFIYSVIAT